MRSSSSIVPDNDHDVYRGLEDFSGLGAPGAGPDVEKTDLEPSPPICWKHYRPFETKPT